MTQRFTRLTPNGAFLIAIGVALILGVIDLASGYELQFFIFYFIPITLAGLRCGLGRTMSVSALCGGLWLAIDIWSGHPYTHWFYAAWSAMIRIGSFMLNGFSVVKIQQLMTTKHQAVSAMEALTREVRMLRRLLPICASCRRVRDDKGYWLQVEEYLERHADALVEHDGYCEICETRKLKEAGIVIPTMPAGNNPPVHMPGDDS